MRGSSTNINFVGNHCIIYLLWWSLFHTVKDTCWDKYCKQYGHVILHYVKMTLLTTRVLTKETTHLGSFPLIRLTAEQLFEIHFALAVPVCVVPVYCYCPATIRQCQYCSVTLTLKF